MVAFALLPAAARSDYDARRIGWSELRLAASKFGFSIESRLEIRRLSGAELDRVLIDPEPGGWLSAPATGGWLVRLNTQGLGRRSRLELMLDSRGASLQRSQIETGRRHKDHRNRTHRFAREAVHIETHKPTRDEIDKPPTDWTDRSIWVQELPEALAEDAVLSQATGLFVTLGASDLSNVGDRMTTHVLSKGHVMQVEMVVEGHEAVAVDLVEIADSRRRRRDGEIDTLRIRLSGRGIGPDAQATDFRFLGMRGEVHVHLDTTTRAPVLITGRAGWLGRAKIRLRHLVLGSH